MEKVLVFSDTHLVGPGEAIIGIDPAARLNDALDHAAAAHPDAVRAVICGDLVHNGRPEEYGQLSTCLRDRPWPVTLMLGNHDARGPFRAAFPQAPVDEAGFVQTVHRHGDVTLICLDTLDEDAEPLHSGVLCADRMAWLQAALADAPGTVIVFLHHPPVRTGFAAMDRIMLRAPEALLGVLAESGKVRLLVAGHVHRTITVSEMGLPVALIKSTCHQMPMELEAARASLSTTGPAGYGILLADTDTAILHNVDFDPAEPPGTHYD